MVGTIFSIYDVPGATPVTEADFLRPGRQQVAAGYVLYGPSVMLVLTAGQGVQMYTLDQHAGEFMLTEARVVDHETHEFAINMSNQRFWSEPMQHYISHLLLGKDGPRDKNFNMRWVAAMVADVHRILCRGGLFAYPWDRREPDKAGQVAADVRSQSDGTADRKSRRRSLDRLRKNPRHATAEHPPARTRDFGIGNGSARPASIIIGSTIPTE